MSSASQPAAQQSPNRLLRWIDHYLARFIAGEDSLPDDQHMSALVRAGMRREVASALPLIVARANRLFAVGAMIVGIFYFAAANALLEKLAPHMSWLPGDWRQGVAGFATVVCTLGTVITAAARPHWEGLRLAQSLAVCLANLGALADDQTNVSEQKPWSDMRERRKDIRARLRRRAWLITGNLSVLVGRHRHERDWPPITATGRWLSWTSEDLDDPVRIRGATYACIDLANHAFGGQPWTPPNVVPPPEQAQLLKPMRPWLLGPMTRLRVALVLLLPFVTAILTFVAKLLG